MNALEIKIAIIKMLQEMMVEKGTDACINTPKDGDLKTIEFLYKNSDGTKFKMVRITIEDV